MATANPAANAAGTSMTQRLAPVRAWWSALAERERRLLLVAAVIVGAALLFLVGVRPAWRTLQQAPAQLQALDEELQSMQRLAAEAQELRAAPPVPASQSAVALKAASDRLGDKAKLSIQGERAVLTLSGVGVEALRSWLAEVRSGARARPIDAQLTRGPEGFTGTLVVLIGGAP